MKFPMTRLRLTIIRFLPISCRNLLDRFHVCLGFLFILLHLHRGLHLVHLWTGRHKSYVEVKYVGCTIRSTVGFQKYFKSDKTVE